MINTVMAIYKEAVIPPESKLIDIPTLPGDHGHLPKSIRLEIKEAVFEFLNLTSSDIMI